MDSSGDDIGTTHARSDMGCPNSMGGFGAGKALVPRSKTDKPCPIGQQVSQGEQAGEAMNRREGGAGISYAMEYLMELKGGDLYDEK